MFSISYCLFNSILRPQSQNSVTSPRICNLITALIALHCTVQQQYSAISCTAALHCTAAVHIQCTYLSCCTALNCSSTVHYPALLHCIVLQQNSAPKCRASLPFTAAVHRTALLNLPSLTIEKYLKAGLNITFFSGQLSWYCVRYVVYTHTITNSGKRWEEQHYWDTGKGTSLQLKKKVVLEMLPI